MSAGGQPHAERIEALLGHYVEQRLVHGVIVDPRKLCQDEPQLLEPLRECIREYEQLDRVLAPPAILAPGRVLLHYRIVDKIGAYVELGMDEIALDMHLGIASHQDVMDSMERFAADVMPQFRDAKLAVGA